MKMIQAKVDMVCYNLESNLNKFKRISSSRGMTVFIMEEPSGADQSKETLNREVPSTDQNIENPLEEEEPIVLEEPEIALEPLEEECGPEPHWMIQSTLLT